MYQSISTPFLCAMCLIGCYAQSSTETPESSVTAKSFAASQPSRFPQRRQSIDQMNDFEPPRQYVRFDASYLPLLLGLGANMGIPFPVFQPPYQFPGMMNDTLNRIMNPSYLQIPPQYAYYPHFGMSPMGQRATLPISSFTGINPINYPAAALRHTAPIPPMYTPANPMENLLFYNALSRMSRYYDSEPEQSGLESSTDNTRSSEQTARRDGPRSYFGRIPLLPVSMPLPYASSFSQDPSNIYPDGIPPIEESPREHAETDTSEQSIKGYMFGFDSNDGNGTDQHRHEESDGKTVYGQYGYRQPNGIFRFVRYRAGDGGFVAQVNSNEPGVANPGSADAEINAGQPPMEAILDGLKAMKTVTVKVAEGPEEDVVLSQAK